MLSTMPCNTNHDAHLPLPPSLTEPSDGLTDHATTPSPHSAIEDQSKTNRHQALLATCRVVEIDVSAALLPVTQLKLEAQRLLARSAPHEGLVRCVGGRADREDGGADELTLDGRAVPAVVVDEAVVVGIGSGGIGDEPDVGLGAGAAGDGAGVVWSGQLGDLDLEHAASCSGGDVGK